MENTNQTKSDSKKLDKTINQEKEKSWHDTMKAFMRPSVITMLFLGFSAGLPLFLIFSSLSLWLVEAGVNKATVTYFSWAALGYSFKFIWAPLVDQLPLPYFTHRFGRRKSWMIFSQIMVITSILGIAFTNPASSENSLTVMALLAVLLGFSSATQDIVVDAYRIESDKIELQAMLSATYIAGYRLGMIVSGAGALLLAKSFGSVQGNYSYSAWKWSYIIMALAMLVGVITAIIMPEPKIEKINKSKYESKDYARFLFLFVIIASSFAGTFFIISNFATYISEFLTNYVGKGLGKFISELIRFFTAVCASVFAAFLILKTNFVNRKMVHASYIDPIKDFFTRYGKSTTLLLLSLIMFYRVSDIVLGIISNVFYYDLGFTKSEIAQAVKVFGVVMSIVGGFLGGVLTVRYGVIRILFLGAVLSAATNFLFMILAQTGHNLSMLYLVLSADNLSAGLATAAFVAFLSSLTNISFTAVQYAIFSSIMTLLPKVIGGYSGTIVEEIGYSNFFALTALMGVPVLFLILKIPKVLGNQK